MASASAFPGRDLFTPFAPTVCQTRQLDHPVPSGPHFPSWRVPLAQHTQPQSGSGCSLSPGESSRRKSTWRGTREGDGLGEARGSRRWARESQAYARCGAAARRSLPSGSRLSPSVGHAEPARRSDPPSPQPRAQLRADSRLLVKSPHRAPRSVGSIRDPHVRGRWDSGLWRTRGAQKIPTPFPGDQATG